MSPTQTLELLAAEGVARTVLQLRIHHAEKFHHTAEADRLIRAANRARDRALMPPIDPVAWLETQRQLLAAIQN